MNEVGSGIYDVGSGKQNTFENVLEILNIDIEYHPETSIPDNYQFSTLADKQKFLKGWKPEFNLEKGLEEYKKSIK